MMVDGALKTGGGTLAEATGIGVVPGAVVQGTGVAEATYGTGVFWVSWQNLMSSGEDFSNQGGSENETAGKGEADGGGARGSANLLKAASAPSKGGLTAVGRALQKHGSRAGSIYPKATGNAASINAQGQSVLKGILNNPNATTVTRHHARFGNIMDIRVPGGQGARFSADGKTFLHFLE